LEVDPAAATSLRVVTLAEELVVLMDSRRNMAQEVLDLATGV
jgi:hypothetical protein